MGTSFRQLAAAFLAGIIVTATATMGLWRPDGARHVSDAHAPMHSVIAAVAFLDPSALAHSAGTGACCPCLGGPGAGPATCEAGPAAVARLRAEVWPAGLAHRPDADPPRS